MNLRVRNLREVGEMVVILLIAALLLDLFLTTGTSDPDDRADGAVLTPIDLDAIEAGEERRVQTYEGRQIRVSGETVEEEDSE